MKKKTRVHMQMNPTINFERRNNEPQLNQWFSVIWWIILQEEAIKLSGEDDPFQNVV